MTPAGVATNPPGAGGMAGRCTTISSATACQPAAHPPPASSPWAWPMALFLLSPVTLLAWAAGQAFLRVTGLRWWKLALASLAAIGLVVSVEGGPGGALAQHFSGYVGWLRQIGAAQLDYPAPGGVPVAATPPGRPGRTAGRRVEPGRPPPGHRPGRGPQAAAGSHPPHGGGRAPGRSRAR
jgi:hypothetical protein